MVTVIEVEKNKNEGTMSLIRRFTKRVQHSGILRTVRAKRYSNRPESEFKKKKSKLRNLVKRDEYERMKKLGKLIKK